MKRALGILFFLVAAMPLYATDTTFELLKAPRIRERMVFRLSGDKLTAAIDNSATFVDITDGAAFVLDQQRDLTFEKFNPFLFSIQTSETTEKDPNFGGIATLLDAIQKMAEKGGALALDVQGPSSASVRDDINFNLRKAIATLRTRSEQSLATSTDCKAYKALRDDLLSLHAAMVKPFLDADEVNAWVVSSTSADGVAAARVKIDGVVKQLNENIDLLKQLDTEIGKRYVPGKSGEDECSTVHASTFAMIYDTARHLSTGIVAKGQLASDLTNLSKTLKPYAEGANWRSDHAGEFIFHRPTPSMDNVKIVSVTIKPRKFTVEDGPSLKVEEGKGVVASLRFRQYAVIVPEIAASIIKTDLKFPKYGTKEVGGKTIVGSAGTDDFPAAGAVVLNGVCRCWPTSFVYPELQFGVTNSKDYPGFLIGGGFRFTYPRPLSVVAGYIYTWSKDLVGLKVGDEVNGTADLESHLQRKSKRASYVGIQYNF